MKKTETIITERIERKILFIRGKKVMLDRDLAKLYAVPTKALNQAVRRNIKRFPADFMFKLTNTELNNETSKLVSFDPAISSRSQIVTLKQGRNVKYLPYAFTEHGILMLSSVLSSERAITINIYIMRVFTRLKELLGQHKELEQRIDALERKYDRKFRNIFEAIRQLLAPPEPPPKPKLPIGFHAFMRPEKTPL
ncbi:MAG: ORF6N domain-containing protein [Candidatus Omnitrophica bacterium]|nr:ORF6N domain-containing protein [Candidatus Omnitrophota bacterium]